MKLYWITPRIVLADAENGIKAATNGKIVINVAGEIDNPKTALLVALERNRCDKERLDFLADQINFFLKNQLGEIIFHCDLGRDRSPLVLAWYFHKHRGLTLDEAYDQIRAVKADIRDRRDWII
jgi:protein-tyrosine phosphatase